MDNSQEIYLYYQESSESTLTKWKIKEKSKVSEQTIICECRSSSDIKVRSKLNGQITKLIATEGQTLKTGDVLAKILLCQHITLWRNMCAECGADLKGVKDRTATIAMEHSIPDLLVSEQCAKELGKLEVDNLLKSRKLVLLLDLDQTLIHTTNNDVSNQLQDVYHFQLKNGKRKVWYHTKFRPHLREFVADVSRLYELHICTFGIREYAHNVANLIDPQRKIFQHRILSRDECFHPSLKTLNLKALFPRGDSMVCIVDDREDVWKNAPNLVPVKPYIYFVETGDINSSHLNPSLPEKTVLKSPGKTGSRKSGSLHQTAKSLDSKSERSTDPIVLPLNKQSNELVHNGSGIIPDIWNVTIKSENLVEESCKMEVEEIQRDLPTTSEAPKVLDNCDATSKVSGSQFSLISASGGRNLIAPDSEMEIDACTVQSMANKSAQTQLIDSVLIGALKNDSILIDPHKNDSVLIGPHKNDSVLIGTHKNDFIPIGPHIEMESADLCDQELPIPKESLNKESVESDSQDFINSDRKAETTCYAANSKSSFEAKFLTKESDITMHKNDDKNVQLERDKNIIINVNSDQNSIVINVNSDKNNIIINVDKYNKVGSEGIQINDAFTSVKDQSQAIKIENDSQIADTNNAEDDHGKTQPVIVQNQSSLVINQPATHQDSLLQNSTQNKQMDLFHGVADVNDSDDYLVSLTEILTRIHAVYYNMYDQAAANHTPPDDIHLKKIVPYVRKKVLKGCSILFSGIYPTNQDFKTAWAYVAARSLGANIHAKLCTAPNHATTHLIAARRGTEKFKMAERQAGIHIVSLEWLKLSAERWARQDEKLFPVINDNSTV